MPLHKSSHFSLDPSFQRSTGNPCHCLKLWDFFPFLLSSRATSVPVICHLVLRVWFWFSEYMINTEKRKLEEIAPLKVKKNNVVAVLLALDHVYFPCCLSMILRPHSWQVVFFFLLHSRWSQHTVKGLWRWSSKGLEFLMPIFSSGFAIQ